MGEDVGASVMAGEDVGAFTMTGEDVGASVMAGEDVGASLNKEGGGVGNLVERSVGDVLGDSDGRKYGVGLILGAFVILEVGLSPGKVDGLLNGLLLGENVGISEGSPPLGLAVG